MISKIGKNNYKGQTYDIYMITGNPARDAEDKPVNGKNHAVVSMAVQENSDGTTMWVNLNGWRNSYLPVVSIRKGDSVMAIGQLKKREYNGKDYYDLDADFVAVSGTAAAQASNRSDLMNRMGAGFGGGSDTGFAEIGEEDGELPF